MWHGTRLLRAAQHCEPASAGGWYKPGTNEVGAPRPGPAIRFTEGPGPRGLTVKSAENWVRVVDLEDPLTVA